MGPDLRNVGAQGQMGTVKEKLGASEDLAAQNPDPAKRNPRPDFGVSCPGDGPRFWGDLGAGWS